MQTLWAQSTQDKHSKSSNVWLPIFDQTLSSFIFLHKQPFGFVTRIYDADLSILVVYLMLYAKCCKLTDQVIHNMFKDCWHMVLLNLKILTKSFISIHSELCLFYVYISITLSYLNLHLEVVCLSCFRKFTFPHAKNEGKYQIQCCKKFMVWYRLVI